MDTIRNAKPVNTEWGDVHCVLTQDGSLMLSLQNVCETLINIKYESVRAKCLRDKKAGKGIDLIDSSTGIREYLTKHQVVHSKTRQAYLLRLEDLEALLCRNNQGMKAQAVEVLCREAFSTTEPELPQRRPSQPTKKVLSTSLKYATSIKVTFALTLTAAVTVTATKDADLPPSLRAEKNALEAWWTQSGVLSRKHSKITAESFSTLWTSGLCMIDGCAMCTICSRQIQRTEPVPYTPVPFVPS